MNATAFAPRRGLALRPGALAVPAILAATVLWGVSTAAGKAALGEWPPLTLAGFRFAVALAVLVPLVRWTGGRIAFGRQTALMGLLGIALHYAVHNVGLAATSAANASLILDGGQPALTVLLGALLLGERPRGRASLGLLVSLAGAGAVALGAGSGGLGTIGRGDALMLVAAACWALYSVLGRRVIPVAGVLPVVAGATAWGLLFLSPAIVVELGRGGLPAPTAGGWGLAVFLGVGCSAVTYVLYGHGLAHLSAWRVASCSTLMPLVGVATAAVALGEPLVGAQALGGCLFLVGVGLTAFPAANTTAKPAPAIGSPRRPLHTTGPARDAMA